MKYLILITTLVSGWAQANEYIHGTVTLKNDETHTGLIRWDEDEETYWSDHFNGEKSEIPGYSELSGDVKDAIEDGQKGPQLDLLSFQIELSSIFADDMDAPDFTLPFAAIQSLTPKSESGREGLEVALHNGDVFFTYEGSNDIDAKIFVNKEDGSVGQFNLKQVKVVTFASSEATRLGPNQGIHGTVESSMGQFKGRIHWDRDERFTHETLEGRDQKQTRSEEVSTAIGSINAISRQDNASLFEMKDGSQVLMGGTNDVDNGNRGLYIDTPQYGRIVLPWKQFTRVDFNEGNDQNWRPYNQKAREKGLLSAVVKRKTGDDLQGNIVFNMAQSSPAEMVRCTVKGMDLYMPMFLMKSIKPVGDQHSEVTLVSGEVMKMYDSSSFTNKNLGLLVDQAGQVEYVPWSEVEEIRFSH